MHLLRTYEVADLKLHNAVVHADEQDYLHPGLSLDTDMLSLPILSHGVPSISPIFRKTALLRSNC